MQTTKSILVVDDDTHILKAVGEAMRQEGFRVETALDGETALMLCRSNPPDLVVLDIGIPGLDGFEVCGRLRMGGNQVPILILSARGEDADKLVGFRLGADDYMTKPFNISELVMRVRAILRRTASTPPPPAERVTAGPLQMDRVTHQASVRGMPVDLTPREFKLLWLMATHPGQVFTRETLLERFWPEVTSADQSSVTVYIRRLREKIEANPSDPAHIKTVWGIGYKFDP
ncbi:MAG TPA: response regulator transcription factor [Symbiobacteriaceae bacterium]|nr:response regulator transcription factor [Symbiobacteriaceae bacterium]